MRTGFARAAARTREEQDYTREQRVELRRSCPLEPNGCAAESRLLDRSTPIPMPPRHRATDRVAALTLQIEPLNRGHDEDAT